jgi:hypothetical protein
MEAVAHETPRRGVEDLLTAGGEVSFGDAWHPQTIIMSYGERPPAEQQREPIVDQAHAYLVVLTGLAVYFVGVSLMTTQVSYPLYASVPREAFVEYHARYNRRIRAVIIVPGFPTFLAWTVFPFVRPDTAPGWAGVLVAAGGITTLATTFGGAIPAHVRLQRDGFTPSAYRRLRTADAIRTAGCVLSAAALIGCTLVVFTPR